MTICPHGFGPVEQIAAHAEASRVDLVALLFAHQIAFSGQE
jgi:hypothetical protein